MGSSKRWRRYTVYSIKNVSRLIQSYHMFELIHLENLSQVERNEISGRDVDFPRPGSFKVKQKRVSSFFKTSPTFTLHKGGTLCRASTGTSWHGELKWLHMRGQNGDATHGVQNLWSIPNVS